MTVFEVLAEPNRRRILDVLRQEERSVSEVVDVIGLSQPAVSKHLRVLRDAGLVGSRVDAQRRRYRVRARPLLEVDDWLRPYRHLWSDAFENLGHHLEDMAASGRGKGGGRVRNG
jgi:DNA-binding transcriptional ArsR family regulator